MTNLNSINRRDFLNLTAIASTGAMLSACSYAPENNVTQIESDLPVEPLSNETMDALVDCWQPIARFYNDLANSGPEFEELKAKFGSNIHEIVSIEPTPVRLAKDIDTGLFVIELKTHGANDSLSTPNLRLSFSNYDKYQNLFYISAIGKEDVEYNLSIFRQDIHPGSVIDGELNQFPSYSYFWSIPATGYIPNIYEQNPDKLIKYQAGNGFNIPLHLNPAEKEDILESADADLLNLMRLDKHLSIYIDNRVTKTLK